MRGRGALAALVAAVLAGCSTSSPARLTSLDVATGEQPAVIVAASHRVPTPAPVPCHPSAKHRCQTNPVGVDPTVKWSQVAVGCDGAAISGVTYNVYLVPGNSVPTVASPNEIPCGVVQLVDRSKASPVNATPVPASACVSGTCSFQSMLGSGTYTAAVEALDASGNPSGVSNTITFVVKSRPGLPTAVTVGP